MLASLSAQGTSAGTQLDKMPGFVRGLLHLAELTPRRTTPAEIVFFLTAARHDLAGAPYTFSEIRDSVGPAVNRSFHTTYRLFLDKPWRRAASEPEQEGLGWLTRCPDPLAGRRKYLKLTERGRTVLDETADAMARRNSQGV